MRPSKRLVQAAILASLTGMLGLLLSLLPFWLDLEDRFGLSLLFALRGARPTPANVAIVSIDKTSADALDLPTDPAKWPRSLHGRLTDTLARAGARVIAFDIFFDQPRAGDDDLEFARSIANARNVVLSKYLARETIRLDGRGGEEGRLNLERLVSPLAVLATAAVASAPFPLPKVPIRVDQYWKFKTESGNVPTLPVVAFQVFAIDAYDDLVELAARLRPAHAPKLLRDGQALLARGQIESAILALRAVFESEPGLADAMVKAARDSSAAATGQQQRLRALIGMYGGASSEYLNFYGGPRTIRALPYHEAVSPETTANPRRLALQDTAVFVGLSEYLRPEQRDGFHTVFSQDTGVDLSGVEIAATAFANLLDDRHLHPLGLPAHAAIVFSVGALAGVVCASLSLARAAASVVAIGLLYVTLAVQRFAIADAWYPTTAPLLFELPAAFLAASLWRYVDTNRERREIRKAFAYHLPSTVIDELARNAASIQGSGRLVYGTCLATDAEAYTSLAESMDPEELARFVNRYYAAVFEPIRRRGGTVSDVVGDAALAIWAATTPDPQLRVGACHAAREIVAAVHRFNQEAGGPRLPTSIGLHSGRMVLGHVGAMDHYEYRAIGDIVNTASRIQGLNKRVGTRILVSAEVVHGLDEFHTRRLGSFLLIGKSRPLVIHELICRRAEASEQQLRSAALFAEGVAAYEQQAWQTAAEIFRACLREAKDDQPVRFYLQACEESHERPSEDSWDGVFRIETK